MLLLRNLLFYPIFYIGGLWFVFGSAVLLALGSRRRFRGTVTGWSRWHRWCARWILGIRQEVTGSQPDVPVLYAIKHESFYEAIDVPAAFPRPAVFAKAALLQIPLWGRAAGRFGVVEVQRDQGARALRGMLTAARAYSAAGHQLVIFPEGTRVPHGARAPLQAGFAGLYKLLGLPVVAVAQDSGPLYHRWLKRPGVVRLHYSDPIPPGLPRDEIETRVLDAINAFNPEAGA